MKIAIDIDGVLMDDDAYVLDCTTKYAYENGLEYIKDPYAFTYKKYNWTKKEINEYRELYLWNYFKNDIPRKFASAIISKLKQEGNKIIIITTRWTASENTKHGNKVKNITKKWLRKHKIAYDKLIFTKGDKVDECKEEKIDILIDDSPSVIAANKGNVKHIFCYDNRYNRNLKSNNIILVFSWYDIYKKIKELEN